MDGRWKRGRHRKRRTDEIEYDLNTIGIKKQVRDFGDGGRLYWNLRYTAEENRDVVRRVRRIEMYFELRSYDVSGQ